MKIKELIYADEICTRTDRAYLNLSLFCGLVSTALFTSLLVLKLMLEPPILILFLLLGVAGSASLVVSAIYAFAIALRKFTLKGIICLLLVAIGIGLIVTVIII